MQVQLKRVDPARVRAQLLCIPMFEGERVQVGSLRTLDRSTGGLIAVVWKAGDFKGKLWSELALYNPNRTGPRRILLLGAGEKRHLDLERMRQVAARAVKRARRVGVSDMSLLFPTQSQLDVEPIAEALTEGCILGDYSFDKYRTEDDELQHLDAVQLVAVEAIDRAVAQRGVDRALIVSEATAFARDLVNAPANELTPTEMAERAVQSGKRYGYKVKVLEREQIAQQQMAGLKAVSQGSDQPPKFIILEYDGGAPGTPCTVFVGKGLTFDSGGICIKPAQKMDEMKGDMGGGAAVIGALEGIARLRLPVHVVGLVPATENMLGGSAYRPGDILTFANGKTVMIDNTDAEGRLVLADALVYAKRYNPDVIIDLATLTGAVLIALGQAATAVLGTNRTLIEELKAAGDRCFERVWELPLWEEFEELLRSPIADLKNTGGKNGGTITAATFLKHFVGETPWAHLDIAGTSYLDKAEGYRPAGGTGVGVRLLVEYMRGRSASAAAAGTVGTAVKLRGARQRAAAEPAAIGKPSPKAKTRARPAKSTAVAKVRATQKPTAKTKARSLQEPPAKTKTKTKTKAKAKAEAKARAAGRAKATGGSAKQKAKANAGRKRM